MWPTGKNGVNHCFGTGYRKKEWKKKKNEDSLRDFGTTLNALTFKL